MAEKINKLSDVYGNSRNIPLTYQERNDVDNRFVNDLTREKHIILHGGSKQGKTSLRKSVLKEEEYIVIQCTRDTTRLMLYEMILKKAGIDYEVSRSITTKGTNKLTVKISGEGKIPFLTKLSADTTGDFSKEKGNTTNYKRLDIDADDPNDIVRVLKAAGFSKYVVIEDFHYLDEDVQSSFAFDLKVFHETSDLVFIIVGVWQESNRLIMYNGDLTGRVTNINVDAWSDPDLRKVIENGEPLLNIDFPDKVKESIISISQDNVGLLQEICYRICEKNNVWRTLDDHTQIGSEEEVVEIAKLISDDQAARYRNFMVKFSEGLSITELEMYKWIIYAVVHCDTQDLRNGVTPGKLFNIIRPNHPKKSTLQLNNLLSALERVQTVQFKHKLQPLILDFSNNNLFVVDANFLVYLNTHNTEELLESIGLGNSDQNNDRR
ncbi:hypothetical protein V9K67_21620 [Paraflavisolibacter sp. H34]|uniref:hypothetical protein n=1 Tax=Huijunlia imazamoxiresistens TaxID=3127457 RepID=UPI003016DF08